MNPNNQPGVPQTPPPYTPSTTPEPLGDDAAALRAIEALEAESNALPGEAEPDAPFITPTPAPVFNPPIIPAEEITPPASIEESTPSVEPALSETPAPTVIEEAPAQPATPPLTGIALSLNETLKNEQPVAQSTFQAFPKVKKSPKKALIVIAVILLLAGLGVGGYFGWTYLQNQQPKDQATTPVVTETEEPVTADTEESVNSTITDIETQLEATDDGPYDDSTLTDETLYKES